MIRVATELAPLLRDARMRIVDRVGECARATGAEAVLVAGDVFDGPMVGDEVLRKLAARLELYQDIRWHFLPGNHDPATPNGIWHRFAAFAVGEHVTVYHEAGLHHLKGDVDVLVAPLRARAIAHDPTEWMMERASAEGVLRVGLAHGAVQGFGSAGLASVLISPDRAVSAGLDYLALGDWHGMQQVGPKAWYAGTPEADRFLDNEPGYVLSVEIAEAGGEPQVRPHRLGQYQWRRQVLTGDLLAALGALETSVAQAAGAAGDWLWRVQVQGRVSLEDEFVLRDRIERLRDRLFFVEADFAQLRVDSDAVAMDTFEDPLLAAVGARLAEKMARGDEDGAVAHEALRLLAGLVRDVEDAA